MGALLLAAAAAGVEGGAEHRLAAAEALAAAVAEALREGGARLGAVTHPVQRPVRLLDRLVDLRLDGAVGLRRLPDGVLRLGLLPVLGVRLDAPPVPGRGALRLLQRAVNGDHL